MSSYAEIHFIFVFRFPFHDDCVVNQNLCYVISNQFCPDFLFDVFWFIRMEITQPDCIFQLTERTFDRPSGVV